MWVAFANAKILVYISVYAIFNDESFNKMLTNNIVSFEQLGPEFKKKKKYINTFVTFCRPYV